MKIKTIEKLLRKKFDSWVESITDADTRKQAERNCFITGGAIVSMLQREKVNDYDIYCKNQHTALLLANYYLAQLPKAGATAIAQDDRIKIIIPSSGIAGEHKDTEEGESVVEDTEDDTEAVNEKPTYRAVFISSNAITLSDSVQIVVRFFGSPDVVHKNFDYVHCTCYWASWDDKLVTPVDALQSIMTKELRYVGSLYPVCSIIRLRKFIARGWTVNAGQILKMIIQCRELNLNDIKVLEDQLVGVDASYFYQIIAQLHETGKNTVDNGYLMTLIDRIF